MAKGYSLSEFSEQKYPIKDEVPMNIGEMQRKLSLRRLRKTDKWRAGCSESCKSGSEGGVMKRTVTRLKGAHCSYLTWSRRAIGSVRSWCGR